MERFADDIVLDDLAADENQLGYRDGGVVEVKGIARPVEVGGSSQTGRVRQFDCDPASDRYRRILPLTARCGEAPFAEPTTAVRRRQREQPVPMPRRCRRGISPVCDRHS
jgi:hypothetical protein